MPTACGAPVKYMWMDHDAAYIDTVNPVQNQWYEVMHDIDVRLIWCQIRQGNDEAAGKTLEVRWTIDGTVYFVLSAQASGVSTWVYRDYNASWGGTAGLKETDSLPNAGYFVDKRGHDFKVEFRITSALGTNQYINCYCVYETLEQVAP